MILTTSTMKFALTGLLAYAVSALAQAPAHISAGQPGHAGRRNVIIFVTDGLRHDAVTAETAPVMYNLRKQGVDFVNSHSLYPTFTTPNASAIATGHYLGDTGDFGNTLYAAHVFRNPGSRTATLTPFIENDGILAELNRVFNGNYLQEETLMRLARRNGYAVATIGKVGPTAIQDVDEVKQNDGVFQPTLAAIMDDSTGAKGIPLPTEIKEQMCVVGLPGAAPNRSNAQSEPEQDNGHSGTLAANWNQQQYFANAVTEAILPAFQKSGRPFFLLFWSRDPDGSQHNQGDSINNLKPGINGPTSRAAIHNADSDLWQIIDYLKNNGLYETTDIIVVADHGFSTISRREIDEHNTPTRSYAARKTYEGLKQGYLPPGFLAIDLAHELKGPLYDPDAPVSRMPDGTEHYKLVSVSDDAPAADRPAYGNGLIGGTGKVPSENEKTDAEIIVAANGGSDLIYLPQENAEANRLLARRIAEFLLQQDYVDGILVRDDLGEVPGTLPTSLIGLKGATNLPRPAIMVNFKSFSLDPSLLQRVEIADTTLGEGQGMHGSFSRADTFNNMIAEGPDFKPGYVDRAPVSNADIAITLAHVLGLKFSDGAGKNRGRVVSESLKGSPEPPQTRPEPLFARQPGPGGARTVLVYQDFAGRRYYDQACLARQTDVKDPCQ